MQSGVSFYLVGVMSLLAQKVLGFTYVTPFTIALDVNEIGEVGGLVSSYLLWVIHCFIVGLKISIIFIISVLRHSLFHCCLMLTQMHRWGLLKVRVPAHIIPNRDFASFNYLFSIRRVCSSFVLSVVFSSQWGGSTSVCFDFATPALFPPYPLARALLVPFPFHTLGKGTATRSPYDWKKWENIFSPRKCFDADQNNGW